MDAITTPNSSPQPCASRTWRVRIAQLAIGSLILGGVPLAAGSAFAASSSGAPSPQLVANGGLDVSGIAAQVDPAIVDINTTLANGGGGRYGNGAHLLG